MSDVTEKQIENLLWRISTDPDFRTELEADPIATCAALDIVIDPSDVPPNGIVLPSRADMLAHLTQLAYVFSQKGCMSKQCHLIWTSAFFSSLPHP